MSYGSHLELAVELNATRAQKVCFKHVYCSQSPDAITQKPNESLCIYVSCYSRLHYVASDEMAHENIDPMRIHHFMASVNNMSIADKVAKHMRDATVTGRTNLLLTLVQSSAI